MQYTTNSAAAAVVLQGKVIPKVTLRSSSGAAYTVTTNMYAGDTAVGVLTFQPPDPTACSSKTGVKTAAIQGTTTLGSSS